MAILRFESPLIWPEWLSVTPRASQQRDSGFAADMTLEQAIGYLDQEVDDMNATGVLLLDMEQPLSRARKKTGNRTGASLRLRHNEAVYMIASDKWQSMEHNIYALHLALRQWRNMERWGVGPMALLLHGYGVGAAPRRENMSSDWSLQPWMEELGLGPTATLDDAVAVYHRRAKALAHDAEGLTRLNILMDDVRVHFGVKDN